MKILLDENFPMRLYRRLRSAGYDAEHIIVLGHRGIQDSAIRERVAGENLVLLTQDSEFEDVAEDYMGTIIISRVRQSLPIQQPTDIWFAALQKFLSQKPAGKLFDLFETGELIAWDIRKSE